MDKEEAEAEMARLQVILEAPKKANLISRAMHKWLLEFLRNCMVVSALFFLAQKSGNWWLYAIAGLGWFSLASYCYTYVDELGFHLQKAKEDRWKRNLRVLMMFIFLQAVQLGIAVGLFLTVNKIVEVQGH